VLVVVLVLENADRFAIRLTEQTSCRTIGLFPVTEPQCTENEDDDEDEDDSKFRNLGLSGASWLCHSEYASLAPLWWEGKARRLRLRQRGGKAGRLRLQRLRLCFQTILRVSEKSVMFLNLLCAYWLSKMTKKSHLSW